MKKSIFFLFTLAGLSGSVQAQRLLNATSTEVKFFSKAPLEDIEASSKQVQSLINLDTKDVVVKIPIKSFTFHNGLMQEHFNENYMESDKYPHGIFKGKITEDIDLSKDGSYPVTAVGKINIHGVEKDKTIKGKATVVQGKLTLDANFDVLLADHKIEIPTMVFQKIAEKIAVTAKFQYQLMDKKQ
ncbi:MAG: YceI family protein [Spirosomataceae bacterium]